MSDDLKKAFVKSLQSNETEYSQLARSTILRSINDERICSECGSNLCAECGECHYTRCVMFVRACPEIEVMLDGLDIQE